ASANFQFIAFALAALVVCQAAQGSEPIKIRLGWTIVPPEIGPILFESGATKHNGTSYVVDAIRFAGTGPMMTAIASNELDVAPLAFAPFGLAIVNAKMDDLRII